MAGPFETSLRAEGEAIQENEKIPAYEQKYAIEL